TIFPIGRTQPGADKTYYRPFSERLWVVGWPGDAPEVEEAEKPPDSPTVVLGPALYSDDVEEEDFRYTGSNVGKGWSGSPIVDERGIVWAVHVSTATSGRKRGHWAFDISNVYRQAEKGRATNAQSPLQ